MGLKFRNLQTALRAPFRNRHGLRGQASAFDTSYDNAYVQKARNVADTADISLGGSTSDNYASYGGEAIPQAAALAIYSEELNAKLVNQVFFIAPKACRVIGISAVHNTICSSTGDYEVVKLNTAGQTIANGVALQASDFDGAATTRVVVDATLTTTEADLDLVAGDRLAIKFTGTLTALTGVTVVVSLADAAEVGEIVSCTAVTALDAIDQCFYIANRDMVITHIDCIIGVAGTDASAVSLQVTKDTSTDAPGAGTDLLLNGASAVGFNMKGAVYTVENGSLVTTAATKMLAAGDRLSLDFAGTVADLAMVCVTVRMKPLNRHVNVSVSNRLAAAMVDNTFFIADRDYRIIDSRAAWSTTSGATTNIQLTKDISNNAPGGGTDLLTQDTAAGWQTDGTANTVEIGPLQTVLATNMLKKGDRLALDHAGTQTNLVGFVASVLLERM